MEPHRHRRVSRAHRLLGLFATLPLLAWVLSSFVLHGVGLVLPNGLQGTYELKPFHSAELRLEQEGLLPPSAIQEALARDGIRRFYWLRLEVVGHGVAYTVKPGPFSLERVYDARTGERMDPLPPELVRAVAEEHLVGTRVADVRPGGEFNRYYLDGELPVLEVEMEGRQPSELVFSLASGRILRRTDPLAAWFDDAYRVLHVFQWGESVFLFTAILYGFAGLTLTLVVLGYALWWGRRRARARWGAGVRPSRRFHARLAPVAGLILASQMLVGAYLWFNLGPIEARFRGQGSFAAEWSGGLSVDEPLAPVEEVAAALPSELLRGPAPIQEFEWRAVGDQRFWLAYPERGKEGVLVDAGTGRVVEALTPEQARVAAESVVLGEAMGPGEESTEYWMDLNLRIPTYRFRFSDPDRTDVHVSQRTGEVIQRRPAIWRAFEPFLLYHTFAFTGNPWSDTLLLSLLQASVLGMVLSGWRLAGVRRRRGVSRSPGF